MNTRDDPKNDWTAGFTLPRFLLLLAVFILIEYPEVIIGTHSFFFREYGYLNVPAAHFTRESLAGGEIPLWNPLNDCGTPFLAQWGTMVGYPLSLIHLLLPMPWSLNYFCLLHLFIAGAGMYALAFRYTQNRFAASLAGLAFALSGLMINLLALPNHLAALAWMPAIIMLLERATTEGRRWIAVAALAGATQMLTGSPFIILLTWLLGLSLWTGRLFSHRPQPADKTLFHFIAAALLSVGIAAFQLMPFYELVNLSNAFLKGATDEAVMPLWGLGNLLLPLFRCQPLGGGVWGQLEQNWTSSYYMGIGVVVLASAAILSREPRARWLVLVSALGLVLACGESGYLWHWLNRAFPWLAAENQPVKFLVLPAFAMPLLAAYVANNADLPAAKNFRRLRLGLWIAGILALMGVAALFASGDTQDAGIRRAVLWSAASRSVLLVLLVASFLSLRRLSSDRTRRRAAWGILILTALDLITHTPRQNPLLADRELLAKPSVQVNPVPKFGRSRAMISHSAQMWLSRREMPEAPGLHWEQMRGALYGDCNLLDGIPKVNGFFPITLRDFADVRALLYEPDKFVPGLADFLGVEQVTAAGELVRWKARKTFMPLVTGGQQPVFASRTNILLALGSPEFNPRRVVYLTESNRAGVTVTNATALEITNMTVSARFITVQVAAAQPAMLVVAQAYYPCWRAYVDGVETTLFRANGAFQALQVPAGRHEVLLAYEDRMFSWGVFISLSSLLFCLWRLTLWEGGKNVPVKSSQTGFISRSAS